MAYFLKKGFLGNVYYQCSDSGSVYKFNSTATNLRMKKTAKGAVLLNGRKKISPPIKSIVSGRFETFKCENQ